MKSSSGNGKQGVVAGAASESDGAAESRAVALGNGAGFNEEQTALQRQAVIVYLRARFGGTLPEDDFEDLAQDALTEVLERQGRGDRIDDPVAYMRSMAWRDARDLIRRRREVATDPGDRILVGVEDQAGLPEQRLGNRADLARAITALEQLAPEHRAAYRARFVDQLSTKEACKRLGLPRSTYHHRLRRALEAVHSTLESERFAELQVKLLGAYVAGIASLAERRRAERLIRNDPQSAAVARELRATHEATATALAPVVVDPGTSIGVVERLAAVPGRIRDAVAGTGGRGEQAADLAGSPIASAGGARGAGAVGAGVVAKVAGVSAAGKVVLGCVGAGAAATACVAAGVLPGGDAMDDEEPERQARAPQQAAKVIDEPPPDVHMPIEDYPAPDPAPNPAPVPTPEDQPPDDEEPEPIAPSAPATEQEFGVASAASPSGGSGDSSGSGGGSALEQEFGP